MTNTKNNKKKKNITRKNFLESLKDFGGGVGTSLKNDVFSGVAKNIPQQMFGQFPKPSGGENPYEQFGGTFEKKEKFKWSGQDFTSLRKEERVLFKKAEQEVKVQIESIRAELVKLVESTQKLTKEVKVAAMQAPVNPGTYDVSFMERLREFIVFMRKNIAESRNWLAMSNQRSKKRSYYWGQVKKSGTKFMLSQERYLATQVG